MIILLSSEFDYSTNMVAKWLDYLNQPFLRINKEDNKYCLDFIGKNKIYFRNKVTNEKINILDAHSCWWRRNGISKNILPISVVDDGALSDLLNVKIRNESSSLIEYIQKSLYNSCSINLGAPFFNLNRLHILDLASQLGLATPEWMVTGSSTHILNYQRQAQSVVTKAIDNGIYDEFNNKRYYTYTELLDPCFFNDESPVELFPSLVTKTVKKKFEIRSFYLADIFYSMAIFSQQDEITTIDFRKGNGSSQTEPYQLPRVIEDKLRTLFKRLSLNSGSADLIVTDTNDYVFLEINPVGQFAMTSIPCNYSLHQKVANYLIYGT